MSISLPGHQAALADAWRRKALRCCDECCHLCPGVPKDTEGAAWEVSGGLKARLPLLPPPDREEGDGISRSCRLPSSCCAHDALNMLLRSITCWHALFCGSLEPTKPPGEECVWVAVSSLILLHAKINPWVLERDGALGERRTACSALGPAKT
jgi:hypothetical protein